MFATPASFWPTPPGPSSPHWRDAPGQHSHSPPLYTGESSPPREAHAGDRKCGGLILPRAPQELASAAPDRQWRKRNVGRGEALPPHILRIRPVKGADRRMDATLRLPFVGAERRGITIPGEEQLLSRAGTILRETRRGGFCGRARRIRSSCMRLPDRWRRCCARFECGISSDRRPESPPRDKAQKAIMKRQWVGSSLSFRRGPRLRMRLTMSEPCGKCGLSSFPGVRTVRLDRDSATMSCSYSSRSRLGSFADE
jgi:hypothetical protein